MSDNDVTTRRERWARFRFSVIGTLLAAPPPPGELEQALRELAGRSWRHPIDATSLRLGFSTIQRWFYQARTSDDPLGGLRAKRRRDAGRLRQLSPALAEVLRAQHRAHGHFSAQLHYENLAAVVAGRPELSPLPSYATVRRFLRLNGLFKQRRRPRQPSPGWEAAQQRLAEFEVRSFEHDHVLALVHGDAHIGSCSVVTTDGQVVKPVLVAALDDCSRVICHAQWFLTESAQTLAHTLSQAIHKRGLFRAFMTDRGAAMCAEEITQGLVRLGILHTPTLPYSAYQNGKIENFWAQLEGRLLAMMSGPTSLGELNITTQAWLEFDYHRRVHSELGCTPLERFLAGPSVARESPSSGALRAAFRRDVVRTQRRSDGTLSLHGQRFEVPSRFRHLHKLHVRYATWDLSRLDLIDPHSQTILGPLHPLDKAANAERRRRALAEPDPTPIGAPAAPARLTQLLAEYAATGLPPAFIPLESDDE